MLEARLSRIHEEIARTIKEIKTKGDNYLAPSFVLDLFAPSGWHPAARPSMYPIAQHFTPQHETLKS
jgi:hypothetical protein